MHGGKCYSLLKQPPPMVQFLLFLEPWPHRLRSLYGLWVTLWRLVRSAKKNYLIDMASERIVFAIKVVRRSIVVGCPSYGGRNYLVEAQPLISPFWTSDQVSLFRAFYRKPKWRPLEFCQPQRGLERIVEHRKTSWEQRFTSPAFWCF